MITPEMLLKTFGVPPVGLLEKSREEVVNFAYFGSSHFDTYVMVNGISRYTGTVDYSRITIQ